MTGIHGRFVWYELVSPDLDRASAFYADAVGWSATWAPGDGMDYRIFSAGADMVAGALALTAEMRDMGVPSCWTGYVGADDVDALAGRVLEAGGGLRVPPTEIPGIGRFAVVADPQGAVLALIRWNDPGSPRHAGMGVPGHIGWHELHAADGAAAMAWYGHVFGWQEVAALDMGPAGLYRQFGTDGGPAVGGMLTKMPGAPGPCWLYYFGVDDIDAAAARVRAGGGAVVNGPQAVPGGAWIVQAVDPQRALFALVGPRRF